MSLPILYPGENRLLTRNLKQADGTALNRTSLVTNGAQVELRQEDTVVATYVWGTDAELRSGTAANALDLELTSAFTADLASGVTLKARWKFQVTDAAYTVEPGKAIDILEEELFSVQ